MNLEAAGAYLEEVRSLRAQTRASLSAVLGVSDDQIMRMEKGRVQMAGPIYARLIEVLGASLQQVNALLTDEAATTEQARDMARGWVARSGAGLPPIEDVEAMFERLLQSTDGDRAVARTLLYELIEKTTKS